MTLPARQAANEALRTRLRVQFERLGYVVLDAFAEQGGDYCVTGRGDDSEVVLQGPLRAALGSLNAHLAPAVREQAIAGAIEQLAANRSQQSLVAANREISQLLKDGVPVEVVAGSGGARETVRVRIIEWDETKPDRNDFRLICNFWLNGQEGRTCLDAVGFVNGLPLLLPLARVARGELDPLRHLYESEISAYKRRFPQLFWYNALILLSNGEQSKLGSLTACWERFTTWKRVASEEEAGDTSLETMLRGTCERARLLDLVENFTVFSAKSSLEKIIALNHQYLGVNAAIARLRHHRELNGKLGVFWHTQGAGKSYSMIFFEQKVQRKLAGNWKFVIITDRKDLDKQLYENFAATKTEAEASGLVHVTRVKDLKNRLRADQRLLFTLIQKYRPDRVEQEYQKVSDDDEIVVIIDEAHRSQYASLAANMRRALPNASFIGFTGTPLIGEEIHRTQEEFGPYISKYSFFQAIEDGVTVELIYDNHTPELMLRPMDHLRELYELEVGTGLDERQKREFRRFLLRRGTLITSGEHLDFVARDLVQHFMTRGYRGKGMVVCLDKLTTVRLYQRVCREWQRYQDELGERIQQESDSDERTRIERDLRYMRETEMAVVFSEADQENERKKHKKFNREHPQEQIDFRPHYAFLKSHPRLDEEFKDEHNPLRLVFVCNMWMTGFDVPCLSTLYLDHPMEMHTLMQAIARPNRVNGPAKIAGQVVDYTGIWDELVAALAVYGRSAGNPDPARSREMPLTDKSEFRAALEQALAELARFCGQQGIDIAQKLVELEQAQTSTARAALFTTVANLLVGREEVKLNFLTLEGRVHRLYQAILPDKDAGHFRERVYFYREIQKVIWAAMHGGNLDELLARGRRVVSESLSVREYEPRWTHPDDPEPLGRFRLSDLDLDGLAARWSAGDRYVQTERLRSLLDQRLQSMIRANPRRVNYAERLQDLIFAYNEGSANIADYPTEIINFARELADEEKRAGHEELGEEELAIADLLAVGMQLTQEDWLLTKEIARNLLAELKASGDLVHSWYTKTDLKNRINLTIMQTLNALPACYNDVYHQKYLETCQYIRVAYANVGGTGPLSA